MLGLAMPAHAPLPVIAIVGRPNVGKSTLFNRYAGRRRALVHDTPGVTRDRLVEEIAVGGRRVLLVDTAGLDPDEDQGLPGAVQAQARIAVKEADAILFVVDGKHGILPEDEAIARTLRRSARPLVLVVNKIDVPGHAARVGEFHRLGIAAMHAVSAEHGTGAFDALEAAVAALPPAGAEPEEEGEAGALRIAIVGRPNVGKSSLVNRLLGSERVVVSDEPGTTRDAIDTLVERDGERFVLVDTAGIRRPGRRSEAIERGSALMAVRSLERADVAFVVIDAHEGFTDADARVAALARERGRAAALLANKWDLVEKQDQGDRTRLREEIANGIRFMSDTPVLTISAKTGLGAARILPMARKLHEAAHREISTGALNRWLQATVTQHEPGMAQRGLRKKPVKFFYATQTAVAPPTFVLFCTEPAAVAPSYRRFLENRLRESFDLTGTPLRLRLRARERKPRSD
jgi:GTP-binding protein